MFNFNKGVKGGAGYIGEGGGSGATGSNTVHAVKDPAFNFYHYLNGKDYLFYDMLKNINDNLIKLLDKK